MAVGDGRERSVFYTTRPLGLKKLTVYLPRFGHVFIMDTGSSAGEISGHSKVRPSVIYPYQATDHTLGHQRSFNSSPKAIPSRHGLRYTKLNPLLFPHAKPYP